MSAAKLRRGSTGPAAGQRKKSPTRGVGGVVHGGPSTSSGVGGVDTGAIQPSAAPAVVEEEEGPSLFGGEPKIY